MALERLGFSMAGHKAVQSQEEVHGYSPVLMGIAAILLFGLLGVCILIVGYKVMLMRLQQPVQRQKFPTMKDDHHSDVESILAEGQWRPSTRKSRDPSLRKPSNPAFRYGCKANDALPEESRALTSDHDNATGMHIRGDDPVHNVPECSRCSGNGNPSHRQASSRQASSRQASSRQAYSRQASSRQVSTRQSAVDAFHDNSSERRAGKHQPEESQQEQARPAPKLTGASNVDLD